MSQNLKITSKHVFGNQEKVLMENTEVKTSRWTVPLSLSLAKSNLFPLSRAAMKSRARPTGLLELFFARSFFSLIKRMYVVYRSHVKAAGMIIQLFYI
jgi:hypothetical protein